MQFLAALLGSVAEEVHEECGCLLRALDFLVVHGLDVLLLLALRFFEGAFLRAGDVGELLTRFLFALLGRGVCFGVEFREGVVLVLARLGDHFLEFSGVL